jgi:DNA-binding MarR family transcriptional regulator
VTEQTPPAASLALDDQLCFALYAASRAVTSAYRPLLDELGLTYPQYLVMLVLWERGSAPVKDLGAALHLDYGTLSPLLKRLEAAGMVRRDRRPDDERSVLVTATEEGLALRARAEQVPVSMVEAFGVTTQQADKLRRVLREIADRVV